MEKTLEETRCIKLNPFTCSAMCLSICRKIRKGRERNEITFLGEEEDGRRLEDAESRMVEEDEETNMVSRDSEVFQDFSIQGKSLHRGSLSLGESVVICAFFSFVCFMLSCSLLGRPGLGYRFGEFPRAEEKLSISYFTNGRSRSGPSP